MKLSGDGRAPGCEALPVFMQIKTIAIKHG
jgi:hypothetical protein